jgi:dihydroflavonol-4-reductase
MKALVTGATGFVGAALCRRLVARGDEVRALIRPTSDRSVLPDGVRILEGDVVEAAGLEAAVAGTDVVFHLAGIRRAPRKAVFQAINVEGTRNVCEAIAAQPTPPRMVHAGSLAASGPAYEGRPLKESDPFRPFEWYGESKADAEGIVRGYGERIPWTVLRPPRILGPGDRENLPFFRIAARGLRLKVGGRRRPMSVVDVEDVVAALLLLAEHDAAPGEAFFIAADGDVSLPELMDRVGEALGRSRLRTVPLPQALLWPLATVADGLARITGKRLPLGRTLVRQLTAPGWVCDAEKAKTRLGWAPKVSIADSVRAAARGYRAQGLI